MEMYPGVIAYGIGGSFVVSGRNYNSGDLIEMNDYDGENCGHQEGNIESSQVWGTSSIKTVY